MNGPDAQWEQGRSADNVPVWQYMPEWTDVGILEIFQDGHQLLWKVGCKLGGCMVEMYRLDECERRDHPRVQYERLVTFIPRQQIQLSQFFLHTLHQMEQATMSFGIREGISEGVDEPDFEIR